MSVYFVQAGDRGPIKIGISKNVNSRISSLQTANSKELVLLGIIESNADENLEAKLHSLFAKDLARGEWFNPSPELLEYICRNTIRLSAKSEIINQTEAYATDFDESDLFIQPDYYFLDLRIEEFTNWDGTTQHRFVASYMSPRSGDTNCAVIPLCDSSEKTSDNFYNNWIRFVRFFENIGIPPCPETAASDKTGEKTERYYYSVIKRISDIIHNDGLRITLSRSGLQRIGCI